MNILRCLAAAVLMVFCAFTSHAAPPEFLQTNIPAWNKILDSKIVQNFHQVSPIYVARTLGELGGAKVVIDIPAKAKFQLISPRYRLVTLRDAFYQLSQDSGLQIDWGYGFGRLPTEIRVSLPPANATPVERDSSS